MPQHQRRLSRGSLVGLFRKQGGSGVSQQALRRLHAAPGTPQAAAGSGPASANPPAAWAALADRRYMLARVGRGVELLAVRLELLQLTLLQHVGVLERLRTRGYVEPAVTPPREDAGRGGRREENATAADEARGTGEKAGRNKKNGRVCILTRRRGANTAHTKGSD